LAIARRTPGGHGGGVDGEEPVELVRVSASGVLEEDPGRVVHHGLEISREPAGDREPRREVVVRACPDEVQRGRPRGPPSQGVGRGGQVVQCS
jgi:hypothetical protein